MLHRLLSSAFSISLPARTERAPKLPAMSLSALQLFVSVGALFGGVALASSPSGAILHMPLSLLAGTPFRDFLIPGLILAIAVGGTSLLGGYVAARRHPDTFLWAILSGITLTLWIAIEVALIGVLHWLQPFYFLLGVLIAAIGLLRR